MADQHVDYATGIVANLTDEQRRKVNARLMAVSSRVITDSTALDGYLELGRKCAELETELVRVKDQRDRLREELAYARRSLWEGERLVRIEALLKETAE